MKVKLGLKIFAHVNVANYDGNNNALSSYSSFSRLIVVSQKCNLEIKKSKAENVFS